MKYVLLLATAVLVSACGQDHNTNDKTSSAMPSSKEVARTANQWTNEAKDALTPDNQAASNEHQSETQPQSSGASDSSGSSSASGSSEGEYTVARGDTLARIAREHDVSTRQLAEWNNLDNPNQIQVGQKLKVSAP